MPLYTRSGVTPQVLHVARLLVILCELDDPASRVVDHPALFGRDASADGSHAEVIVADEVGDVAAGLLGVGEYHHLRTVQPGEEFLVEGVRRNTLVHGSGQSAHAAFVDGYVSFLVEDHVGIDDVPAVDEFELIPVGQRAFQHGPLPFDGLRAESLAFAGPVTHQRRQSRKEIVEIAAVIAASGPVEFGRIAAAVHFEFGVVPRQHEAERFLFARLQCGFQGHGASAPLFARRREQCDAVVRCFEFAVAAERLPRLVARGEVVGRECREPGRGVGLRQNGHFVDVILEIGPFGLQRACRELPHSGHRAALPCAGEGLLQRTFGPLFAVAQVVAALSEKLAVHAFDAFGFADAPSDEILPREGHGRLASFGGFQLDVEERQRKARILDVVRNERGAGADADFYARKHLSGVEFGAGEQSGVIGRGNALHAVLHQRVAHEPACVRRAAAAMPEREERSGAFADGQVYVVHSDPDEASVGCELHVARPDAAQRHATGGGVVFQPEAVEIGASAQKSLRGDETYVGCAGAVVGFLRVQTGGREEQAERRVQEFDSHGFRGFTA